MVEIQCPHCEKDIELEDGLYGAFDCPYCNNEFVWEDNENGEQTANYQIGKFEPMPLGFKIVFLIIPVLAIVIIIISLFLIVVFGGVWS